MIGERPGIPNDFGTHRLVPATGRSSPQDRDQPCELPWAASGFLAEIDRMQLAGR